MPTTYTDQFFTFDPANPPAGGTSVTHVSYDLIDQNDDGDVDRFNNDSVNGSDVSSSYPGDTVTINVPGTGNVTYVGTTFYLANGQRVFTPTDGQVLENGTFVSSTWVSGQGPLDVGDLGPPCFAAGTLIETERGMTAVQDIQVGDLVRTLDNGLQSVRWRGSRSTPALDKRAPIRFAAGAIGNERELLVSPQHKILLTGWRAELYFGEDEVLVAAAHLVNADTIHRAPRRHIDYHHMMFDAHEIVLAEGIPTESFYPGEYILQDSDLHDEVTALFPEMIGTTDAAWTFARPVMHGREAKVLCSDKLFVV
ncbi:Hint domain-containing protein [Octadecabacter sp. 1_MG-2023]|uniref:Hint domain-containing protein n=1 Tax=unclassified Octadecabacter TaxID=196158 RepID=UPI001C083D23|nr:MULTISPECIES: Hint domain-containing protein [unclassified Octadecabacter]MBU2992238.1 Hint domain-containing protein [Octadecabacter sp. B2R22]MDO6735006.1 Hint domain-containing protein [Octadecabacter sp. 1_MG-2023]